MKNRETIDWLLEKNNPAVRYGTLRFLLEAAEDDSELVSARRAIMEEGIVPRILEKLEDGGYWGASDSFYTMKYSGTVWNLIILAEHWAEAADPRIEKACSFILENSQDRESGGFSMHRCASGGGRHSEVIPCLTGNMVWSLARLGQAGDDRVTRGLEWLARYGRFDDGDTRPPAEWPYDRYEMCWGAHTCFMGTVKALKAFAEIPSGKWTPEVRKAIESGVEFLLRHHVFKRSRDLSKVSKPGWRKFGFPRMYQTDVLEILGILARLGIKDDRTREAVDLVVRAQNEKGRWISAADFPGKFAVDFDAKGQESKWLTLNALRVLKGFYGE